MRRRLQWFVGGALLFALLLGTAGRSFAAQEWNVTGSGTLPGIGVGTATFSLNAVVLMGSGMPDLPPGFPATGSFTYRDTSAYPPPDDSPTRFPSGFAIRGTFQGGEIMKGAGSGGVGDVALLFGTYALAGVTGHCEIGVAETGVASPDAPAMAIFILDGPLMGYSNVGNLVSGRVRIFSQDQQGGNGQGGNQQ